MPPPALPGKRTLDTLSTGMRVALLDTPQAEVVGMALWIRAGARDDPSGHGGTAHFLEHLLFRGSHRFGPGEHDRRIQALGGNTHAVTGHDATVFSTAIAATHWREVLELEAERMARPRLDSEAVDRERQVIVAELALDDEDPWDALRREVDAMLYGPHPYGRPILGTREELEAIGVEELRAFYRQRYRPDHTVLAMSGRLPEREQVLAAVEELFENGASTGRPPVSSPVSSPEPPTPARSGWSRVTQTASGRTARLLLALPAPVPDHPDHVALHLLSFLLGRGRGSRLVGALVEGDDPLCSAVGVSLSTAVDPGAFTVAAEALPGATPAHIERTVLAALADLTRNPPTAEETRRAREMALARWTLDHQRIAEQAMALGREATLHSPGWLQQRLEAMARVTPEELQEAAARHRTADLETGRGVIGWSLPVRGPQ